jgi:23S rRNA pseudouridine1911/1915/1917 synthase
MSDIKEMDEDLSLLDSLATIFPDSSRTTLRRMLQASRVEVDGEIIHSAKHEVIKGQKIKIRTRSEIVPAPAKKTAGGRPIEVLFEDEHLFVLAKPPGLLTVATDKMENNTLHSRAVDHVKRGDKKRWAYIVHRLDKKTSGIIVFAKSEDVKMELQNQFADRDVERIYHAVVEGELEGNGVISNYLREDKRLRVLAFDSKVGGSKEAITEWESKKKGPIYTYVKLIIQTGRRNQIRVHMADMGFPLAGDKEHGAQSNPLNRLCLHASKLSFQHPITGERIAIIHNPPNRFLKLTKEN